MASSLTLDARKDLTTGRSKLRHDELQKAIVPKSLTVTWNQTARQVVEPDTLFGPMDTDKELLIPQGTPGGFIASGGWTNGTDVAWTSPGAIQVPGAYRMGVAATKRNNGGIWFPNDGMLDPTNFHMEAAFKATVDWTSFSTGIQNLFNWGLTGNSLLLTAAGSGAPKITLTYQHGQDPAVGLAGHTYTLTYPNVGNLTVGTFPANTEVFIAWSMATAPSASTGTLTLYINGTQVAQATGVVPARLFSAAPPGNGFTLLGQGTVSADQVSVSDFKISRTPRVPGVPVTVTDANTLTVNPASTTGATINKRLPGLLHHFKGEPAAVAANGSPNAPVVNVIRTAQMLNATPIKAGATDATHPTLGQSGLYSYDWSWVDRTVKHVTGTNPGDMGCELYLSLSSTPQLLGGSTTPLSYQPATTSGAQTPDVSGTLVCQGSISLLAAPSKFSAPNGNVYAYSGKSGSSLTGVTLFAGSPGVQIPANTVIQAGKQYTSEQSFANQVPNDFTALGHMMADLVYHIIIELAAPVAYVALWNEPQGSSFWLGTEAQYLTMYQTVMPMVRAVAPSVKLGGPEFTGWPPNAFWIQDLINLCATNSLPLDFIGVHYYSGDLSQLAQIDAAIRFWSTAAGRAMPPELTVGESNYGANVASTKAMDAGYLYDDWSAAQLARVFIEEQRLGVKRHIFLDAAGNWNGLDDGATINKAGIPWAPWNTMLLWSMLAPNVISQTLNADPGIGAVASIDGAGKTTVLIANLHFRKWREPQTTPPQTVQVNVTGAADGTSVQCWMIDDERSNQYDAGIANAALTQVTVPAISGGAIYVPMKARSVALVQVGP